MASSIVYNMDCMEYMKSLPDKAFSLAVVDPPYGGGCSQNVQVEREREAGYAVDEENIAEQSSVASAVGLTATISASRTGGKWATRYQVQKGGVSLARTSGTGTSPRSRNTLTSWRGSVRIKSYGVAIISRYRRRDASLCGANSPSAKTFLWQWQSMRGQVSTTMQKSLNARHRERPNGSESTRARSQWRYMHGYTADMQNRGTGFWIRISEAGRAVLPHGTRGWISSGWSWTRPISTWKKSDLRSIPRN